MIIVPSRSRAGVHREQAPASRRSRRPNFALLADATDGGRRGRAYGWVSALSSLGIVVGAIAASQIWARTGDVGLGLLMTAVALAVVAGFLPLHPRDRPARGT